MKIDELRVKPLSDLKTYLLDLRKEQFSLRMQKASGQLSKPHQVQQVKRNIARLKMVISHKECSK